MKRDKSTAGRRLGATTMALVAAALTAAAFAAFSIAQSGDSNGGNGDGAGPSAAPPGPPPQLGSPPSGEDREALDAFKECMEENGAPPPPQRGDGPPEPPTQEQRGQIDKAFEACKSELPEGARGLPMPPPCHDEGDKVDGDREARP